MANTINIPRTHLIMGLCLPMAVLLGYFLAQPLESGSIAVITLVFSLLCVPLLMKWHHPLLVLSWNACANPLFLPGAPSLWMLMGLVSLVFAILARSTNPQRRFVNAPSIIKPLLFLVFVVLTTAFMTGGIGIRALGSSNYGGRGYFYIIGAIAGYFALTSQRIPEHKASLYVSMFFLSGLTALVGDIALRAGPNFYFLTMVFVPDLGAEQTMVADLAAMPTMFRMGALMVSGAAIYAWMLSRYGIRGVFNIRRPWRMLLVFAAVIAGLASGFRSSMIVFSLTFFFLFCFEGLHRTRLLPILSAFLLVACMIVLPRADKLPIMAQRALSFLPAVPVDPVAKDSARASTEWRVEMWKQVLPQVPKYLIKGKGYVIDPADLFMAQISANRGFGIQAAGALVAGDYHNGPLSILIPFGLFGLAAFIWLMTASIRLLYYHHRFSTPALQRVNTFLLAAFVAKIVSFAFVFGALYSDLFAFTGLIGLSVSLNGRPGESPVSEPATDSLTVFTERAY